MPLLPANSASIRNSVLVRNSGFAWLAIFVLALGTIAATEALGQFVAASLRGTVQDRSGASIREAKVEVTNVSTGVTVRAVTDANGRFVFESLPPGGPYKISIEATGFNTEDRSGINLAVNQVVDINIPLQVGETAQRVEVNADATQLETDTAAVGITYR
jgi:hypothetical protein